MRKELTIAGLVLALGSFVAAEQPRAAAPVGQSQNQNAAVQITQQPKVEFANQNSAKIAWSTNVQAGSVVKYGTDPNNLSQTATAPWGGTTHRVQINNLQPGTTYYYQAMSAHASGSGTQALGPVGQFTTAGNNGQTAQYGNNGQYGNNRQYGNNGQYGNNSYPSSQSMPNAQGRQDNVQILAGPVVQNLTGNSASLWWQTDDRAATHVKYGTEPNNLGQSAYEPGGSRNHTVQLSGLQPGQTYYFQLMRQDGSVRTQGQFMTPGQNAMNTRGQQNQITNGPMLDMVGSNNAIVSWSTAAPASSVVRYGTNPNSLNQTAQAPWGSTTHRVTLNNLQPNTHYYFEVISSQSRGSNAMAQSTGQFHTVGQGQQAMTIRH